ncbi:MAG: hypothetical protein ACKVP3_09920 [Hyphomicrobiaceae bacterium]
MDERPLGSIADVKRHLGDAFPGMRFTWVDAEPRGVAAPGERVSLLRRFWLTLIGRRVSYAHWTGAYGGPGYAVELYFEAGELVCWVRATVSKPTADVRGRLDRLSVATGWNAVFSR